MPPVDEGCRTTRTSMSIITIQGKRSTAPSGIDIFELPFSRIRRRKKAKPGDRRSVSPDRSLREGRFGDDGMRFKIFCTSPIDADSQQLGSCTAQTCWGVNWWLQPRVERSSSETQSQRTTSGVVGRGCRSRANVLVEAVARRQCERF